MHTRVTAVDWEERMAKRATTDRRPPSVARTGTPPRTVLDDQALALGTRIRERRRALGLSLVRLAEITDLSHPFLSQVERGHARPSVMSLQRIADALDVEVGWLFSEGTTPRAAAHAVYAEDASEEADGLGAVRRLRAPGWKVGLSAAAAVPSSFGEATTAPGESVLYVVTGGLEVDVDGTLHDLETGDALFISGGAVTRARSTGAHAARVLVARIEQATAQRG